MSIKLEDLKLSLNNDIEIVEWEGQKIEVKQYLPIQDKLTLIATIINDSIDTNDFYNPAKVYVYTILETIMAYTNLELTDEEKEKTAEIYDLFVNSGFSAKVFEQINPYEYSQIKQWVFETIDSIYKYKNSVLGLLETINEDYKDAEFDTEQISEKLKANTEDIQLLKDVMDKLG